MKMYLFQLNENEIELKIFKCLRRTCRFRNINYYHIFAEKRFLFLLGHHQN